MSELEREEIDIIRLIRTENVGIKTFYSLIDMFGSATVALEHVASMSIRGGRSSPIKVFSELDVEKELKKLQQIGAKCIVYTNNAYPKLLKHISDPPPVLNYFGDIDLLSKRTVAVVGARNASLNGKIFAEKISAELSELGIVVISGMARGIDTAAHNGSIKNGTVAVIAGGIDHIYPQENTLLYERIKKDGVIIAELPVGASPLAQHFPQRNRIISGLSLGVVVVEAAMKSGSLITAKLALEQGREVFAIPGFPMDPRSNGTNYLIKSGAHVVETSEDITNNLPLFKVDQTSLFEIKKTFDSNLSFDAISDSVRRDIIDAISHHPIGMNTIAEHLGIPIQIVCAVVVELELSGNVLRHMDNKVSARIVSE